MALVRRIRVYRAWSLNERLNRASVSRWCGLPLSCSHWRMAPLARVSIGLRSCVVFPGCGAVAHRGRDSQYGRTGRSRLFLVLLCERAFPQIPRKALSARLQQASLGALLVSAPGLVVPLESLSACDHSNHHRRPKGAPRRLHCAYPTALLDIGWPGSRFLRDLHESGVLHVPCLSSLDDVDCRWCCAQ